MALASSSLPSSFGSQLVEIKRHEFLGNRRAPSPRGRRRPFPRGRHRLSRLSGDELIDDYAIEVLITLAFVTCTYAIAQRLHLSGPLSVVAAGLLIGERGPRDAMSDRTQTYVFGLWTLIDEILNSVLFLLIGLEVFVLQFDPQRCCLRGRQSRLFFSVGFSPSPARRYCSIATNLMSLRNIPFFTWAGVRGGISVALALATPDGPARPVILASTYAVVLFSIIIQGSTLGIMLRSAKPSESLP